MLTPIPYASETGLVCRVDRSASHVEPLHQSFMGTAHVLPRVGDWVRDRVTTVGGEPRQSIRIRSALAQDLARAAA